MQAVTADDPGEMHARISEFRGLGFRGLGLGFRGLV